MLDRLFNLLRPPEAKASRTAQLIQIESGGRARWTPRDYAALAREGFICNAIVHRAVKLVAENVAGASWLVYEGAALREPHPLSDLLARPNPRQERVVFLEAVCSHLMLAGNAYIEAVSVEGQGTNDVRELYALRPDRMRVVPGPDGWPEAYEYTIGARSVRFDQSAALPPILHLTQFHPLDDHYGLSSLEAAAVAVDTHNAAAKWNKALLDNAARPSGALVYSGPEGAVLSDGQFERLKRELEDNYKGAINAGRPLVLEGGYTNHPSDPGGPTNFGITLADYRRHLKPDATAADVRAMKLSEAKAIYRARYWDALCCDGLPAGVDYAVFDYGVNSGIGRAGKVLRRVLKLSDASWTVTDAVQSRVRAFAAGELVRAICDERLSFLQRLKTWPVFGAGWGRRVAEVRAVALAMARDDALPKTAAREADATAAGKTPGKAVVPVNASAQKTTAGGIAAGGAAAAQQANEAGMRPSIVIAIMLVTIVLAIGGWFAWRWLQRRRQEAAN